MVKLTRIYTGSGDKGKTSLGTGSRVLKSNPRILAIGKVDETNAAIGIARIYTTKETQKELKHIQNDLFDLGADLCIPKGAELTITKSQCIWLENHMDAINTSLSPLTSFVLPGGTPGAAHLHVARTIARDAERHVVALMQEEEVNADALIYLNRLSDFLFVLARQQNNSGENDVLWTPENTKRNIGVYEVNALLLIKYVIGYNVFICIKKR